MRPSVLKVTVVVTGLIPSGVTGAGQITCMYWGAPVQVKLLPISDKFLPYTEIVLSELKNADIRAEIDDRNEKIGKKIAPSFATAPNHDGEFWPYVRDDKLVAWGWEPGGTRTLPPASRAQTVAAFKTWMDAGATHLDYRVRAADVGRRLRIVSTATAGGRPATASQTTKPVR